MGAIAFEVARRAPSMSFVFHRNLQRRTTPTAAVPAGKRAEVPQQPPRPAPYARTGRTPPMRLQQAPPAVVPAARPAVPSARPVAWPAVALAPPRLPPASLVRTSEPPPPPIRKSAERREQPAETRPVSGPVAVHEAVLRRVRDGVWRLPPFATNGDRRLFKQQVAVYGLLTALPEHALQTGVLGSGATADLPDADARQRLIARVVSRKAGPEGANAAGAAAAWQLLVAASQRAKRTQLLPAGPAMVAAAIEHERLRAAAAARGSRGGVTRRTGTCRCASRPSASTRSSNAARTC